MRWFSKFQLEHWHVTQQEIHFKSDCWGRNIYIILIRRLECYLKRTWEILTYPQPSPNSNHKKWSMRHWSLVHNLQPTGKSVQLLQLMRCQITLEERYENQEQHQVNKHAYVFLQKKNKKLISVRAECGSHESCQDTFLKHFMGTKWLACGTWGCNDA